MLKRNGIPFLHVQNQTFFIELANYNGSGELLLEYLHFITLNENVVEWHSFRLVCYFKVVAFFASSLLSGGFLLFRLFRTSALEISMN